MKSKMGWVKSPVGSLCLCCWHLWSLPKTRTSQNPRIREQWTIVAFNQSKHASNCAYYTPLYCNRYWFELKTKAPVCNFHQNADKTRISHMAAQFSLFHLNEYISYRAHCIHNSPPKWLRNSPGTGSRTFHSDQCTIDFVWRSIWSWVRTRKRDPVDMEIIRLHVTLWWRIGLIRISDHVCCCMCPFACLVTIMRSGSQLEWAHRGVDSFKYSFFVRIIPVWNRLPTSVVTAPSIEQFQDLALPELRVMKPTPTHLKL